MGAQAGVCPRRAVPDTNEVRNRETARAVASSWRRDAGIDRWVEVLVYASSERCFSRDRNPGPRKDKARPISCFFVFQRAPHGRACGSARAIRRTARQFSSFRAKGLVEARALAALVSEAYRFAGLVPCKSFFKACDACPPFPDRVSVLSRLKRRKVPLHRKKCSI